MAWWKEVLGKMKLVDVQASLKTDQAGIVNVKVENNTYNLNFPDAQPIEAFKAAAITVDFEQAVKEEVSKQLEPLSRALSTLSPGVSGEIVVASTMTTAIDKINEDEFIRACNVELKKHDFFEEGMEIVPSPEGSRGAGMSGYSWKGPEDKRLVFSDVVRKVKEKHKIRVTPRKPQ